MLTALGPLRAIAGSAVSGRCVLAVRPENVAVGGPGAGDGNRVTGTVSLVSYLGNTLRYDVETESGLVLWPQFVGTSLASLVIGQFMFRSGRLRRMALAGPFVLTIGVVLLWRMGPDATSGEIARNTVLSGVGWGMMAQVFIVSVQNAVPRTLITSATALMVFSRSMGAAIGVAAMGAVVDRRLPAGLRLEPDQLGQGATAAAATFSSVDNCKSRCPNWPTAGDKDRSCWFMHVNNAKVPDPEQDSVHCPHATGMSLCNAIPQ